MGLNFNYLLYFKCEYLWDALQGMGEISDQYDYAHTIVHFPERDLILPIMTAFGEKNEIQYDAPEFNFATSLIFEKDEAILEFMRGMLEEEVHRAPPDPDGINHVAVGFIYLTV